MMAIEFVMFVAALSLGVIASVLDIRKGIVPNRIIIAFLAIGAVLDVIYYGVFVRDIVGAFFANLIIVIIIALCMFYTHSLAGGDCKLIIVLGVLYPARYYLSYRSTILTLFVAICFAILLGYAYMLVTALIRIITGRNIITKKYVGSFIITYLKSYLTAFVYVTLVNLVFVLISRYLIEINKAIILASCLVVAWVSGKVRILKNKYILGILVAVDICLAVLTRTLPFSTNIGSYIFTAVLLLCQMTIKTNLYETIPTDTVKQGMILSTITSMTMQNSKIKDLPGVSVEDLRNRITEEQAEAIRRWGNTEKGQNEVVIVRKIPFAIFVFLGFVLYFVIWRIIG